MTPECPPVGGAAAWERWTNRAHLVAWCTVAFFAGALVRAWWSAAL